MKKESLKYYLGIMFIISFDLLKNVFFGKDLSVDVYLFYEHDRYVDNILYDLSNLFKFSILTYWLIKVNRIIFTPLFITSLISWGFYFAFYNGLLSLLIIPLYVIITFMYHRKIIMK